MHTVTARSAIPQAVFISVKTSEENCVESCHVSATVSTLNQPNEKMLIKGETNTQINVQIIFAASSQW